MGAFDGISNWVKSQWHGYDVAAQKKKDEETRRATSRLERQAVARARTPQDRARVTQTIIRNNRPEPIETRSTFEQIVNPAVGSVASFASKLPANIGSMVGTAMQDPVSAVKTLYKPALAPGMYAIDQTRNFINNNFKTNIPQNPITSIDNAMSAPVQRAVQNATPQGIKNVGQNIEGMANRSATNIDRNIGRSRFSPQAKPGENRFITNLSAGAGSLGASLALSKVPGGTFVPAATFGVNAAGDQVRNARANGASAGDAFNYGVQGGVLEMGLEKVGLDRFLKAVGGTNIVKSTIKNFINEGVQEGMQSLAQSATTAQYSDVNAQQAITEALTEALYGGIIGGGSTAIATSTNKLIQSGMTPQEAKALISKTVQKVRQTTSITENALKNITNGQLSRNDLSTLSDYADYRAGRYDPGKDLNNLIKESSSIADRIGLDLRTGSPAEINQRVGSFLENIDSKLQAQLQGGFIAGPLALDFNKQKEAGRVFDGVDGKPRFEVDDSNARFLPATKEFKNKFNLNDPAMGKLWTADLSEVLDHPELFKQYPNLKNVKVKTVGGDLGNERGRYDPATNTIELSSNIGDVDQFETIMHELQHSIQNIEGFQRGSMPDKVGGYDNYRNLAGEAEARAVASRMNMSDGERYKMPDNAVYHGTGAEFDAFSDSFRGTATKSESAKRATFFTDSREVAQGYADYAADDAVVNKMNERVRALEDKARRTRSQADWDAYDKAVIEQEKMATYDSIQNRLKNSKVKAVTVDGDFLEVDAQGKTPSELAGAKSMDSWLNAQLDKAQSQGKAGVKFVNLDDTANGVGKASTHYAVFDNKNIKPAKPQSTFYDSLDVPKEDLIIRDSQGGGGKAMSVDYESINEAQDNAKTFMKQMIDKYQPQKQGRSMKITDMMSKSEKAQMDKLNKIADDLDKKAQPQTPQTPKRSQLSAFDNPQKMDLNTLDQALKNVGDNVTEQQLVNEYKSLDRRRLSGKALDVPSQKIGRALGMTDAQMEAASRQDNLSEPNQQKVKRLESRYLTTRLNQPAFRAPANQTTESATAETSTDLQDREIRAIPYNNNIAQTVNEVVKLPEVKRSKANVIDYFRTPQKVLEKIGLADAGKALVEADKAYKKELPQKIEVVTEWYNRIGKSQEASQRIFQYLDGQKGAASRLQGNEMEVATEMKKYLEEWADRLKLPQENRVTNYITHIFEDQLIEKDFDPDLARLIDDKVPGSVYDPFTQQRLGAKGYVEDAIRALDAYTKRAVRKANMDSALEVLKKQSDSLDVESWKYVKRLGDRINMRPTELDNLIDNFVKSTPIGYRLGARPTARVTQAIRKATYRATLGLNVGSAVRNLTQGINTFAELGGQYTGVGYAKVIGKMFNGGNTELEQVGVLDNSFIEDRTLSAKHQAAQKMDKVLFSMFEKAEEINRGAAYYGAKQKALSQGKSETEAVTAGVEAARKTQFTFGRVDTPIALQGDINKLFTQFQSYNVKQAEFIGGMISNKEYAKMTRYTVATLAVFALMSKALGYRPEDMLPFGSNVKDQKIPIAGAPAFRVIPEAIDFGKAVFSTPSENAKTTKSEKIAEAGKDLFSAVGSTTIPGFVQAKKSYGGVKTFQAGEMDRYGEGTVKIEQTPQNLAKGVVFGPYAMKTVETPTDKTVKTSGEVVRPKGQIAITTKTEKDASGKFISRDKYDAVINAYTKANKTLDDGTTTAIGNIQKYDNKELSGAIKDVANEAVEYLKQVGVTGIKADSKLAVLYAKYKKSTAQDPDKAFAQALVKAYPELKTETSSKKTSRKSGRSGGRTGTKTALKNAISIATANTPNLPAFKLSGTKAPQAKLRIPSVNTGNISAKGRQYTVKTKKLA